MPDNHFPEQESAAPCCCGGRQTVRNEKQLKDLQNRLSRIEGQVRGVKKMLDNNVYCVDILTQVAAINAALNSFNKTLLASHISTCFVDDIKQDREGAVDELVGIIHKLMK